MYVFLLSWTLDTEQGHFQYQNKHLKWIPNDPKKQISVFHHITWKKAWEVLSDSISVHPEAKKFGPYKQLGSYVLGGIINQVFFCLENLQADAFLYEAYWVGLCTAYLIAVLWHQRSQQLSHSFLKYSPGVLFFCLKKNMYLVELNIFVQNQHLLLERRVSLSISLALHYSKLHWK